MSLGLSVHEGAEVSTLGPHSLNMDNVLAKLREDFPGINADRGGRLDMWHPKIEKIQGIYFGDKHITSADRGWSPQWPIFSTIDELCPVPLSYALLHDDFPVLDIMPGQDPSDMPYVTQDSCAEALVMRPKLDDIDFVGWAETFWKLAHAKIPGLDSYYLSTTFCVPMDWVSKHKIPPIAEAFKRARTHCGGV